MSVFRIQVQVASYILIPQRNVYEYFIFFQMHADRVIKDDEYMIIYLISSKTDKPNLFFIIIYLFYFFTLFWNKHRETRPWICKKMVNYYSSANVESPQHFILLQIIMIWKGQVPTVITQFDKRNQTLVRLNDNTL